MNGLEDRVRILETSQAVTQIEVREGINGLREDIKGLTRSVEQSNAARDKMWELLNCHTTSIANHSVIIAEIEKKKINWSNIIAWASTAIVIIGAVFTTLKEK